MSKTTKRGLLALSLFLVLFPLATHKPGLPVTLKADEPAYYMMALSLAHDFDLLCELKDIRRGFDEYPYLPQRNFILMTDDAWETTYYGKPFIYSLMAAPLARFFGANGLVSLNMLFLCAMMWMGISYLRRFNGDGLAALFTVGFFLVSHAFSYTFWLQPELFNMASGMLCLYLVFAARDPESKRTGPLAKLRDKLFRPELLPAWSGAALALSIYNKPVMLALALPVVLAGPRRGLIRRGAAFAAGVAIVMGLLSGFSVLMTGHPSAYLGVDRVGVTAKTPDRMPVPVPTVDIEGSDDGDKNSWWWIFRIPTEFRFGVFVDNVSYFLWGRHTGLFPYELFGILAFGLFLMNSPRSGKRWWLVVSLASVALFFIIWIPFNWHGGGGFIGNRYFVNVYPGFLFLVTRIRPIGGVYLAYAIGSLYLGPMLLTPFGAPVPEPTLQAHTRGAPYRILPLEFTVRHKVPGYGSGGHSGIGYLGRKDASRVNNETMWLHGNKAVELWITSETPIESAVFELVNRAPGNRIEVDVAGHREVFNFPEEGEPHKEQFTAAPRDYSIVRNWRGEPYYLYKTVVESETGKRMTTSRERPDEFYVGAQLTYLGTPDVFVEDVYKIRWLKCRVPRRVEAGETFYLPVEFRNASTEVWANEGPVRISLSYHWLDQAGETIVRDGRRTDLRRPLQPGKRMKDRQEIRAPEEPGTYRLELDPLREKIAWFSERDPGDECSGVVEVVPAPEAELDDAEPTPPAAPATG